MTIAPHVSGILEAAGLCRRPGRGCRVLRGHAWTDRDRTGAGRHVFYRCGATILLVFRAAETRVPSSNAALPVPTHGADGQGHVCFAVDGPALDVVRSALGQGTHSGRSGLFAWPNGARSVYVRDPAGNSVEFAEPRLWGTTT